MDVLNPILVINVNTLDLRTFGLFGQNAFGVF